MTVTSYETVRYRFAGMCETCKHYVKSKDTCVQSPYIIDYDHGACYEKKKVANNVLR